MQRQMVSILVIYCVVLIGCGGDGKSGQGNISISLPGSFKIEVTIDANGGEIVVQDSNSTIYGARFKVHAGALNAPTNITLEEGPVGGDVQGERSLRFGPAGTMFAKPAPTTAPYTDEFVQQYEVDPQEMLLVLDDGSDIIEIVQPTTVDPVGRTVSGEINHFSILRSLDYRTLLLFRDPYAFLDGAPTPVTVLLPPTGGGIAFPLIARSFPQTTIVMGKGKLADIGKPGKRTLILVPGLTAPPTTFYYDEQGKKENHNDFSWLLRNDPAFSGMYDNVIVFKYPSGKPVEEVAQHFARLIRRFVPQGSLVDILPHSLGCIVVRQAIEDDDISPYVENVFFLAGPHEGGELSKLATFLTRNHLTNVFVKGLIPSGEQVTIGSTFLANLNANFPGRKLASTKYHFTASKTDELVNLNSAIPAFMNISLSDILILDTESHWGVHGNAKNNNVAMQIRTWKGQPNRGPVADAGQDQTVTMNTLVTLTGSATDPDKDSIISYEWKQTSGPAVTLSSTTAQTTTFTPTTVGTYTFTLEASDGFATGAPDTTTVTVTPYKTIMTVIADVYVDDNNRSQNYGGDYKLKTGVLFTNVFRSFIKLEAGTTIPQGATIISAALHLSPGAQVWPGYSATITETNAGWDEYVVTWGKQPQKIGSSLGTMTYPNWRIDVTSFIQSRTAQGIAAGTWFSFAIDGVNNYLEFNSRESGGIYASRIVIDWTP